MAVEEVGEFKEEAVDGVTVTKEGDDKCDEACEMFLKSLQYLMGGGL